MFKYKTVAELNKLTPQELILYKKAMGVQSKLLLAQATSWKETYVALNKELNERLLHLECSLLEAELDRVESDNSDYGQIGYIH